MITSIKVHFDGATKKHRVDVVFTEAVSRLVGRVVGEQDAGGSCLHHAEDFSEARGLSEADALEDDVAKKQQGSGVISAAEHAYPVTVE